MDYIECQFKLSPFQPFNEIIVSQLGELEFESFVEEAGESIVKAYIPKNLFEEDKVQEVLELFKGELTANFSFQTIEKVNWNKKWEENFDAVEVDDFCYVRAPFHESKAEFQHEIIIEPKMSFGTGHHQTTQMMIELMKDIDFEGKSVLDMGSGTGILAALAKKMGSEKTDAIDIEEWAFENMKENFQRNKVDVKAYLGDAELLSSLSNSYDVVIANINKNILLRDFPIYNKSLKSKGLLLLSGFYQSDEEDIVASDSLKGYTKVDIRMKDGWCALKLQKA